ncbi:MFS transporter [Roseivivax halodurans JCM 10272]|uniref:MFS transporter n=1 Tax=Roseivivax halodurans JCM 10272 TaxID=1449350 RepID=X7EC75_9RHOB|nr:MFS transporter [Roseivivax halodurans]ETX13699.1 MFS transporter [Roseivivax halodurans JCM 10272]
MSRSAAALCLALSLFLVTYAVNLQAPLYDAYAAASGRGPAAVTIAFAAYVAGLMPTVLFLGGLSDRIGRRIPVVTALLLGAAATALLVVSPSWTTLVLARTLLGIGTGLATTAGTAFMIELMGTERSRSAALAVTSATSLGFGGGALATGISLSLAGPSFFPASFAVLFVLAPLLALGIICAPKVAQPQSGALLRLPVFPKGTWIFGATLALAWSATGMIIAVVPLELAMQGLSGWTGAVIFLAIFIGFLCQPIAKCLSDETSLALGLALIPSGFGLILFGNWMQAIAPVLAGTALSSAASYGFVYLAALSQVSDRSGRDRSRATAGLFVYAYAGFSLPVIGSGVLAETMGLIPAMGVFLALLILGAIALASCLSAGSNAPVEQAT